jgi:hypothetical protein
MSTVRQLNVSLTHYGPALAVVPIDSEAVALQHSQFDRRLSSVSSMTLHLLPEGPTNAFAKHGRIDVDGIDLVDRTGNRPVLDVANYLPRTFRHVNRRPARRRSIVSVEYQRTSVSSVASGEMRPRYVWRQPAAAIRAISWMSSCVARRMMGILRLHH